MACSYERCGQGNGPAARGSTRGLLCMLNQTAGTTGAGSVLDTLVPQKFIDDGVNSAKTDNHGTPTDVTFGATGIIDGGGTAASFNGTTSRIQFGNAAELRAMLDFDQPFTLSLWHRVSITRAGTVDTALAGCQEYTDTGGQDYRGVSFRLIHAGGATLLRIQMIRVFTSGTDMINFQTNALDLQNGTEYFITFAHERVGGLHTFRITATPKAGSTVAAESAVFQTGTSSSVASSITTTAVFQIGCTGTGSSNHLFNGGVSHGAILTPRYEPLEILQERFDAGKADEPEAAIHANLGHAKGLLEAGRCVLRDIGDSTSEGGDTDVGACFAERLLLAGIVDKISGYYLEAAASRLVNPDEIVFPAGVAEVPVDEAPPNCCSSITPQRGRRMLELLHDAGNPAAGTYLLRLVMPSALTLNQTRMTRPRARWLVAKDADVTSFLRFGLVADGSTDQMTADTQLTDVAADVVAIDKASSVDATGNIEARVFAGGQNEAGTYWAAYGCLMLDDADLTGLIAVGGSSKSGSTMGNHAEQNPADPDFLYPAEWETETFEPAALAGLTISGRVVIVRLDINTVNAGADAAAMLGLMEILRDELEAIGYTVVFEQAWECWMSSGTSAPSRVPAARMKSLWTGAYSQVITGGNGTCGAYSAYHYFGSVPFFLLETGVAFAIHSRGSAESLALSAPLGAAMQGATAVHAGGGRRVGTGRISGRTARWANRVRR